MAETSTNQATGTTDTGRTERDSATPSQSPAAGTVSTESAGVSSAEFNALKKAVVEQTRRADKLETLIAQQAVRPTASIRALVDGEQAKATIPADTFEVGGKMYKFLVPQFAYDGGTITATDALSDDDILTALVARGSGVIQEVI